MKPDYLAEGLALDPAVQDLLLDAADVGRIQVSTSAVALVRALAVRPSVVQVSGYLTIRGRRVAYSLIDAGVRHSGALPPVNPPATQSGDTDVVPSA